MKALHRVNNYAARKQELKRLWIDPRNHPLAKAGAASLQTSSSTRSSSVASVRQSNLRKPGQVTRHAAPGVTPAGSDALSQAQIRELMSRDLTPEDYELLLLLDEGIQKPGR